MSVTTIQYKGIDVLYTDLSSKSTEEAILIIEMANRIVRSKTPKSVTSLINIKGLRYNAAFLDEMKQSGKENEPYISVTAVFGLLALTKLIGKGIALIHRSKHSVF